MGDWGLVFTVYGLGFRVWGSVYRKVSGATVARDDVSKVEVRCPHLHPFGLRRRPAVKPLAGSPRLAFYDVIVKCHF